MKKHSKANLVFQNGQLPPLYSRRADGGIHEWCITINGDSYHTSSGTTNGIKTTSSPTFCVAKNPGRSNETSPQQQAVLEAKSLWEKKLAEGYKMFQADIDEQTVFWPMLAKHYEDYAHLVIQAFDGDDPVFIQPKLDGMRCIVRADGMWSRRGKRIISAPHIMQAWSSVLNKYPDTVIDGELYADKYAKNFDAIISLSRKTKPSEEDLRLSLYNLEYHTYDVCPPGGDYTPFRHRLQFLKRLYKEFRPKYSKLVKTHRIINSDQLDMIASEHLTQGYEGSIIRLNSAYEQGKRTNKLLKYKTFKDEEFEIIDVLEGIGGRANMAGALRLKMRDGGEFQAAIQGNEAKYIQMLKDRNQLKGKIATVQYQNLTPKGKPRFPSVKCIRDYE